MLYCKASIYYLLFYLFLGQALLFAKTREIRNIKGNILFLEDAAHIPHGWHHKDFNSDEIVGISTEKYYSNNQIPLNSKKIIVAIIDSGIDINHEDLQGHIWINKKEIPNNGIDDDNNGYIDDVAGWNFIGNKKGSGKFIHLDPDKGTVLFEKGPKKYQLTSDTFDITRKYKYLSQIPKNQLTAAEEKEIHILLKTLNKKILRAKKLYEEYQIDEKVFTHSASLLNFNPATVSLEEVQSVNIDLSNQEKVYAKQALINFLSKDNDLNYILSQKDEYKTQFEVHYNIQNNDRFNLVEDNENKLTEKGYGNNDVIGPSPLHGTHVAGILAADRDNNFGVKGISHNVQIMPLRVVPNGDERDKDVINAIHYAVDNGARIINLSFGKYFSQHKKDVQKAILYAEKHHVLIVQAAGNDYENLDKKTSYPNPFINGKKINNFLLIGATTPYFDETLITAFTNYGKKTVDILAPGLYIYSTIPGNKYASMSGTSTAAPIVTGIIANLLSYNDSLSNTELKELLFSGVLNLNSHLIRKPGVGEAPLEDIVSIPGIVNMSNSYQKLKEKFLFPNFL